MIENNHNQGTKNSTRRAFLGKASLTSGLVAAGFTGVASACNEEDESYDDVEDYNDKSVDGDSYTHNKCIDGSETGTRLQASSSCLYLYTRMNTPTSRYEHLFANHAYAQHHSQTNYPDSCVWEHTPGIQSQRWSARDNSESNQLDSQMGDHAAIYPPISEDEQNISGLNLVYTGLKLALSEAIPNPVMAAGAITGALINEDGSSSGFNWDLRHNWNDYPTHEGCMAHWTYWGSVGDWHYADVTSEDYFRGEYGAVWVEHDMFIMDPDYRDESEEPHSSVETQGQQLSEGDVIELEDGANAEITTSRTKTKKSDKVKKIPVNEEVFKRRHPESYNRAGAPEFVYKFPVSTKTTTNVAKII